MIENTPFLLSKSAFEQIIAASRDEKAFSFFGEETPTRDLLTVSDGIATIEIDGVLRAKPSFLDFFGIGTRYDEIAAALSKAEQDPSVKSIVLRIDSPGGDVAGVDILGLQIKNTDKHTSAYVVNHAHSAAYWLASQADEIVASTDTASVGSIGVLTTIMDATEAYKREGLEFHTIVSSGSPKKVSDASTEEGRTHIRTHLDALFDIFAARVADGRGTSGGDVRKNYGLGDIVFAKKALENGMIDRISDSEQKHLYEKEDDMTDEEKKAVWSEATTAERSRVVTLLAWNKTEASREVAVQAIREGKTQEQVLAQLIHATQATDAYADAQTENVPDISTASEEQDSEKSQEAKVAEVSSRLLAMISQDRR